jgi:hypothetical protein
MDLGCIGTGPRDAMAPSAITWTTIYERLGTGRLGTGRLGTGRLGTGRLGTGRLGTAFLCISL